MRFNTIARSLRADEEQSNRLAAAITYHPEPQTQIDVFDDACFFPDAHCLYDRDGNRIDASLQLRNRRIADNYWPGNLSPRREIPQDVPVCHHPVVFLGVLFPHYGHFLLECSARIWAIPQLVRDEGPVKFLYSESSRGSFWRDGYVAECMHLAGIPLQDFVFFDTPVRLRRVYVPHATFVQDNEAHPNHVDFYRRAAARFLRERPPPLTDRPLYISRRRYQPNPWEIGRVRHCANEAELEEILANEGFLICHAEMLSLQQKIALYNSHRVIIGARGSGLLTALFSLNGKDQETHSFYEATQLHELVAYGLSDLLAGVTAYYVGTATLHTGDILAPDRYPDGSIIHRIDLDQTLAWLTERGLVRPRPRRRHGRALITGTAGAEAAGGMALVHLQDHGDTIDADSLSGGRRHSRRYLTGLCLSLAAVPDEQLEYRIVTDEGVPSEWVPGGTYCGTRGLERPLRGLAVRLRGEADSRYSIRVVAAFIGVEGVLWASDGALCRASPDAPLEAFRLFVDARDIAAPPR